MPFTKPSAKPNQQLNASALKPGVRQLRARLIANAPKRNPKLTPHQKKEARQRLPKGESTRDLAKSYRVSISTISRLAS
jgi:DNA invertase Pin-like site-specific DNA recombinase